MANYSGFQFSSASITITKQHTVKYDVYVSDKQRILLLWNSSEVSELYDVRFNNVILSLYPFGVYETHEITLANNWIISGWNTVVITFDSGVVRIYLNNILSGSYDYESPELLSEGFDCDRIVYLWESYVFPSNAIYDEFYLWNRILTTSEITALQTEFYETGSGVNAYKFEVSFPFDYDEASIAGNIYLEKFLAPTIEEKIIHYISAEFDHANKKVSVYFPELVYSQRYDLKLTSWILDVLQERNLIASEKIYITWDGDVDSPIITSDPDYVYIETIEPTATSYYTATTDGSTPSDPDDTATQYTSKITPSGIPYKIKAISKRFTLYSGVQGMNWTSVSAPSIVKSGSYVVMSTTTPNSRIYYTYNATEVPADPTTSSNVYTGQIPLGYGYYKAATYKFGSVSSVSSVNIAEIWTPADIETEIWLDASDLTTITKDSSNLVSQWNDKSGNGNNVTASGTTKPLYSTNKITFSQDEMFTNLLLQGNSVLTCTLTTFESSSNFAGALLSVRNLTQSYDFNNSSSARLIGRDLGNNKVMIQCNNKKPSITINTSELYTIITSISTAGLNIWVDAGFGTGAADTGINLNTTAGLKIGQSNYDLNDENWDGEVREIIITYDNSTETRQRIEGYLAWKWDEINGNTELVTKLPSEHPYKTERP